MICGRHSKMYVEERRVDWSRKLQPPHAINLQRRKEVIVENADRGITLLHIYPEYYIPD